MKVSRSGSIQRAQSRPLTPWLLAALLLGAAHGPACSSDEPATEPPVDLGVNVALIDGKTPGDPVLLHCDGTIAVEVVLSADPMERPFVLRPARACGSSGRCGFVRIEALDSAGETLASVDTATTSGVLRVAVEDLPRVAQIRAGLRRGIDDEPVLDPDGTEVTTTSSPSFVPPSGCPSSGGGAGGEGAGGSPAQVGSGGQMSGSGGSPGENLGGMGGAAGAMGGTGETAGGTDALGGSPG